MVLFNSTLKEHKVLSTYRESWAVVGWFSIDNKTKVGVRGGNDKNSSKI